MAQAATHTQKRTQLAGSIHVKIAACSHLLDLMYLQSNRAVAGDTYDMAKAGAIRVEALVRVVTSAHMFVSPPSCLCISVGA